MRKAADGGDGDWDGGAEDGGRRHHRFNEDGGHRIPKGLLRDLIKKNHN